MKLKLSKTTISTFSILILSSLVININTVTPLASLYDSMVSGELFSDFDVVFTYEYYLFFRLFVLCFISSSLIGLVVYNCYSLQLQSTVRPLSRFFIMWSIVALLAYIAYLFHVHYFGKEFLTLSCNEYKFGKAIGYIGRTFNLGIISISIASFVYNKKNEEKKQQKINTLTLENLKYEFSVLKTQVNPRFLFNSINTLNQLIEEKPKIKPLCVKITTGDSFIEVSNPICKKWEIMESTGTGLYNLLQRYSLII